MKKQSLVFLHILCLSVAGNAQQFSKTNLNTDGNSTDFLFNINGLPGLSRNANFMELPFYDIFWLFGNGEYGYSRGVRACCTTDCNTQSTCSHNASIRYHYPQPNGIKYNANALILSRKGDDPPPPPALPSLMVSVQGRGSAPTPRLRNIAPGKKIDLAHSHGYLHKHRGVGEKSFFIISYKADSCLLGDSARVYLFYGRKRSGSILNLSDAHFMPSVEPQFIPTYIPGQSPIRWSNRYYQSQQSPFTHCDVFDLLPDYMSNVATTIGQNEEQRIFREVQFKIDSDLGPNEQSYAIAVLTTKSTSCNSPCNGKGLQMINGLDIPGYKWQDCTLNGQKIIDCDEILLKSGEPDDPNNLKITEVCKDGTVRFRLNFCNDPKAMNWASGAQVVFSILDNEHFEWCTTPNQILFPDNTSKEVIKSSSTSRGINVNCEAINILDQRYAYYNCRNKSFKINDKLPVGACASIDVILKYKKTVPHESEVDIFSKLLEYKPVLKASVWLCPNPNVLTLSNTVLPPLSPEFGLSPVVKNCAVSCQKCAKKWWQRRDSSEIKSKKPCLFDRSFWRFGGRKKQ